MTEPSEAAKAKANELADHEGSTLRAFIRFIQQVSDAAKLARQSSGMYADFDAFILPEPVDPLLEALRSKIDICCEQGHADNLREALAKRGLKIVEADHAE